MKVYGLPEGQGLDQLNYMAWAAGKGHTNLLVDTLAQGSP